MDADRYPNVVRAFTETPWAIRPEVLAVIANIVAERAAGHRPTAEEIQEWVGARAPNRPAYGSGAVAVLPLYGVIFPRASMMSQMSGGTSLDSWTAALKQAAADPQIASILIDVDSPGGSTAMVPEAAAQIRAAREQKRIVAVANPDAGSAAYWLAAQADELIATPSGEVGSIGVFCVHDDLSAMLEQAGVKRTIVSQGKYKVELSPLGPLSEEAHAALQGLVDEFYGMFVADVAAGRGVSEADVRNGFGQGRMLTAKLARKAGMVDGVATFEATLQRMLGAPNPGRQAAFGAGYPPGVDIFDGGVELDTDAEDLEVTVGALADEPAEEPETAELPQEDEPAEDEPDGEPEAAEPGEPIGLRRRRLELAARAPVGVHSPTGVR